MKTKYKELVKILDMKKKIAEHVDDEFIPSFYHHFAKYLGFIDLSVERERSPILTDKKYPVIIFECSAKIKIVFGEEVIPIHQPITISGVCDLLTNAYPVPEKTKASFSNNYFHETDNVYEAIFLTFKKQLLDS